MIIMIIVLFFLFTIPNLIESQIQRNGQFVSSVRQIYYAKAKVAESIKGIKYVLPFQNSTALEEADHLKKSTTPPPFETSKDIHMSPLSFAKAVSVSIDSRVQGVWQDDLNTNLRIWTVIIESKTALSLSLIFDHFQLPISGEMYILTPSAIVGAYNILSNTPDGKFSVQPIKGSKLFVMYVEPLNAPKALKYLKISQVVHGYKDIFRVNAPFIEKDMSGLCNVDVRCVNSFVRTINIVFI